MVSFQAFLLADNFACKSKTKQCRLPTKPSHLEFPSGTALFWVGFFFQPKHRGKSVYNEHSGKAFLFSSQLHSLENTEINTHSSFTSVDRWLIFCQITRLALSFTGIHTRTQFIQENVKQLVEKYGIKGLAPKLNRLSLHFQVPAS